MVSVSYLTRPFLYQKEDTRNKRHGIAYTVSMILAPTKGYSLALYNDI